MDCTSVGEIANSIEISLEQWKEAVGEDERQAFERAIGEELFHNIFQADTTILGPWHLRTSGAQKVDRYCEFKNKWDYLCSRKVLQAHIKDLKPI